MKILVLNSSFRKDGNTQRTVECIMEEYIKMAGIKNNPPEFETIYLAYEDIWSCRGCRACFDKGEGSCPNKDGVPAIKASLDSADGVILASPVYVEDINGIMKNWIDRMAYNNHRPSLMGKPAIAVTTSGAYSTGHALKTIATAYSAWGGVLCGQGKFRTGAHSNKESIKCGNYKRIRKLAGKLLSALGREKAHPTVYSLVAFRVQQRYWQKKDDTGSYDYLYWKEKGWLDSSCSYYSENQASMLKVKLAGSLGRIVALLFS